MIKFIYIIRNTYLAVVPKGFLAIREAWCRMSIRASPCSSNNHLITNSSDTPSGEMMDTEEQSDIIDELTMLGIECEASVFNGLHTVRLITEKLSQFGAQIYRDALGERGFDVRLRAHPIGWQVHIAGRRS